MILTLVVGFVVIFALVLIAVSLGLKFFEDRRRHHVGEMLRTLDDTRPAAASKLLRDLAEPRAGGIGRLLESCNFTHAARRRIQQAGLDWHPQKLVALMAMLGAAGFLLGLRLAFLGGGAVTGLALGVVAGSLPYLYVRRKSSKRLAEMEAQFPEALDFLSRSMRAGHAFTISLEMLSEELAAPLGQEFRTLFNEQNLGAPIETALRNLTLRVPLLDVKFFASAILLQRQTGGNLSEILVRLAYLIRERFRLKGQVRASSAHGRMTATILTLLPVATVCALLVVAPGYLQGMAADPDGRKLIAAALIAQVLGNICIKKIIHIKV
jgi:tight adherence protein B